MAADAALKTINPAWTDQQRRAIAARDVSVALSAGAGCGKTYVLTERFLSHLEPGPREGIQRTRLGQLVAITFTERAAREMRDRIRSACHKRLSECPEPEVDHWLQLLRELDTARISTIHSFCASLLRSHAVEAGLDPHFRVLDQVQADTLLIELIDDHLRDKLADQDNAVMDLIVRYGLSALREMIAHLLRRRQEIDWSYWQTVSPDQLTAKWQDYHRREALSRILQSIAASIPAKTVLEIARQKPCANALMQERMAFLLEHLPRLPECDAPAEVLPKLREAAKVQGAGKKTDWPGDELYENYKQSGKQLRDIIDRYKERLAFDPEAARPAAEMCLHLLALAHGANQAYEAEKQQSGALDFNDLLIQAKKLLIGPRQKPLRERWAANLRLLLVDEFQDTDPLQVELVEALCDNEVTRGKLFFVGDFKQSIYRFRGADPRVFRRLREKIPPAGQLPLSLNFRSQPAILDFINTLFNEEFGPDYEPLRAQRPQITPAPAVEFLWAAEHDSLTENETANSTDSGTNSSDESSPTNDEQSDLDQTPVERRRRREADWIARRIRAMVDSGAKIVWDKEAAKAGNSATRRVQLGDIALLFRALTNIEYYEEALRRYGIDYYLVGGHAFYAQQEVFDLLNLLRALESPCDQIGLSGVLRSPFFNLLDETIFWLARHPDGLCAGLFAETLPHQLNEPQRRQAVFAAQTISELRAIKDRVPIHRLIHEALDRTAYDAALLAEFLGERKLANLYKLIEQARNFDQAGLFTLADFITQLSEFVARQPDEPLAATQAETMNVVRLMTIHQAKGLEFPVVIVPDLARSQRDPVAKVAFTPELGPLIKDHETPGGYYLFSLSENEQAAAEIIRLLYVAATRAADYLILSSGVEKLGERKGPWMELLARRFDLLSGKALQADLQVKVIKSPPPLQGEPSESTERPRLKKLLEKARKMAQKGEGRLPKYLDPIAPDPRARRQFSFSRLSGSLHDYTPSNIVSVEELEQSPEISLDPRGLGTLVHAALAEVNFAEPGDYAAIIRRHASLHLAQAEVDLDEPIEMLGRFLASPRAAQIAAAQEVHRELEFMLAWPPDSRDPDARYLQGFIDCLYRNAAGEWRIIDYKTNHVTAETLSQVAAPYEMQMLVYALAVEIVIKQPPAELALHFLRPGLEYHFPWNANSKKSMIDLINRTLP
jgi:ATP-dependent helicase/nuclease subunit A